MEDWMRKLPWLMLAGGLVLSAAPARAQTYDPSYPVCLKVYSGSSGGGGEYNDCTYTSLAQCAASASGRAATCMVNPLYAPAYRTPPEGFYRRHRHAY
jgi:Protein of unknown function (DUF3551)